MKFFSAILALCALNEAAAYTYRAPRTSSGLYSSPQDTNPGSSVLRAPDSTRRVDGFRADQPGQGNRENFFMERERSQGPNIWEKLKHPVAVQGGSLRTWSFATHKIDRVGVFMKTDGRPLNANVELWHGPDNTPQKMSVYIEDGSQRSFNCVIETPSGTSAIAVRNTGQMEFPLDAAVEANVGNDELTGDGKKLAEMTTGRILQGGSIQTYPFDPEINRVQILMHTDGRPLNARIELLQGPNNKKQVVECYTEDGLSRPFSMILDTPGPSNVIRLVNTATMEYPITTYVDAYPVTRRERKPTATSSAALNSNANFNEYQRGGYQGGNSPFYFLGQ